MNIPTDLKYTKDHEWVKINGNEATVGITEFAQQELGEVVFYESPAQGKKITKGSTLCVVESTKAASDVYAPITGTVKESNESLSNSPSLINESPYDSGWLVKLTEINTDELNDLMDATAYKKHVGA